MTCVDCGFVPGSSWPEPGWFLLREVLRLVLARGFFLMGLGMLIGLPLSFLLANVLASFIFGVGANEALAFSGISVFLAGIALAACYIPARRAMRLEPTVALRDE